MNLLNFRDLLKSKRNTVVSIICFIVIIFILAFIFWPSAERMINVLFFEGNVSIDRPNHSEALSVFEGMRLESGDTVITEEASSVTLSIDEDKIVRIAENSLVRFDEISNRKNEQVTNIYVNNGTVINDIQKKLKADSTYKITTPNATVSVRGTYFTVNVSAMNGYDGIVTTVNVYQGSVQAVSASGEVTILYANGDSESRISDKILVPSGNHAIIGNQSMTIYDYVTYDHLSQTDLERLSEIIDIPDPVSDHKLIPEKVTAFQTEQPTASANKNVPASDSSQETAESRYHSHKQNDSEFSNIWENDFKVPPVNIILIPSDNQNKENFVPVANDKEKDTDSAFLSPTIKPDITVKPTSSSIPPVLPTPVAPTPSVPVLPTPVAPTAIPTPSGPTYDEILAQEKVDYAPVLLSIEDRTAVEAALNDINQKYSSLKAAGLTAELDEVKDKVDATNKLLKDIDRTNAVINSINNLPYPIEITEANRARILSTRSSYSNLTTQQKDLIPEKTLEKLEKCEEALN